MIYNRVRYSRQGRTPVVILWGQSVMETGEAAGNNPAVIYRNAQNARIYWMGSGVISNSPQLGTFPNLQWGVNNKWRAVNGCGPELGIAHHLYTDYGVENLVILKIALGGSPMVDDGTVSAVGLWQKNPNPANVSGYGWCNIALFNFIVPAILKLINDGEDPYLLALGGSQGEADSVTQFRAENWYPKAVEMISYWFEVLNMIGCDTSRAIVTHAKLWDGYNPGTRPYLSTVQAAQQALCDYFGGVCIKNANSWTYNVDNTHPTWQSQCADHGKTVADIWGSRLIC